LLIGNHSEWHREMAAGREPAVELEGLARNFGRRWALRGITLSIRPGEAVALVGRNGSGKTTLLRVLATLLRPSRGRARVAGLDVVREAASVRELVALMGHSPGIYDDLTAAENLRFALRMLGRPVEEAHVMASLEAVGLGAEAGVRVRGFSAGMRRRLALARLRLQRPRILLLDEPYASFDAEGVELLNDFVLETAGRGGAAIVATHDLARAEDVVGRIVTLEGGRLVSDELAGEPGAASASGGRLAARANLPQEPQPT
jgi:heme exporter protein A